MNAHEMIVTTQSFATGGWGPDESFQRAESGALYDSLTKIKHSFETPCGSYAHFKLTRYLLRVTRDGKYGDSMERVFYNTVLGAKPRLADGHSFYYSDYSNTATKYYHDDPGLAARGRCRRWRRITGSRRISTMRMGCG